MIVPREYLLMHIVTKDTVIVDANTLTSASLEAEYTRNIYTGESENPSPYEEYVNLGELITTDKDIYINKHNMLIQKGIKVERGESFWHVTIEETPWYVKLFNTIKECL